MARIAYIRVSTEEQDTMRLEEFDGRAEYRQILHRKNKRQERRQIHSLKP